jgi:hypothetical protein
VRVKSKGVDVYAKDQLETKNALPYEQKNLFGLHFRPTGLPRYRRTVSRDLADLLDHRRWNNSRSIGCKTPLPVSSLLRIDKEGAGNMPAPSK